MVTQLELARQAEVRFAVQGSIWSERLLAVGRYCSVRQIRQLVSPPTKQLMERLPARSEWIPGIAIVEVDAAIYDLAGSEVCELCASITSEADTLRAARVKFAEMLLRAFGTSPHTILQNMNSLVKDIVRGIEYQYERTGPRSGAMMVTYSESARLPMSTFVSVGGGFRAVFSFTRAQGTVSVPEVTESPERNAAKFSLCWE